MPFIPPRCPYLACPQHRDPQPHFWRRHGSYLPQCRRQPVPRFRCKTCGRTFSRQTFSHDYRDRRPECNVDLFWLLVGGMGLRQSARRLGLDVHAVQRKFHKIAATCRWLHRNLSPRLPAGRTFLLDEEETYEKASIRPLTMPVLIERETYFVVATMAGPIRRLAAAGLRRRGLQERDEARRGPRRDRSRACVRATLRSLRGRLGGGDLCLQSDDKASYGVLAREVFGDAVRHETTPGRMARGTFNPLFPINLTLAMTRDNCGRLRRQSWLVTETRRCLQRHLQLFAVYRNYVRARHNTDRPDDTPAVLLGLLPQRLRVEDVLRWRQDWGPRSPHPCCRAALRSVA